MKLLKLRLINFKGIKAFELDLQGSNAAIFGDNSTGKTSIFDAFLWLLFDKDSQNQAQFDIKTLDENGDPIHGLDHEVEGVLEVDGREVKLRKLYKEKWTKKRGAAEKVFSGHTVDHFIDGVPIKKSEYQDFIQDIADEDAFKLLTSPTYFNSLHWQKRREILMEICGDVSMEEVVGSNKELKQLPEILGDRTAEDHKKVLLGKRKEINRELERIPVRIDEVTQGLPDIIGVAPDVEDIKKIDQQISEIQNERAALKEGGMAAKLNNRLTEIEGEVLKIMHEQREINEAKNQDFNEKASKLQDRINELKSNIKTLERGKRDKEKTIEQLESDMEVLRTRWHGENEQNFEAEDVCPTCGQDVPQERIEEARAEFNKAKAEKLKKIQANGQQTKNEAEELQAEIEELNVEHQSAVDALETADKQLTEIRSQQMDVLGQLAEYKSRDDYKALIAEKEKIEKDLQDVVEAQQEALAEIEKKIKALQEDRQTIEETLTKVKRHE